MNLLKNFSDYPFLIHRLPQKGNLPQVKKHCSSLIYYNMLDTAINSLFDVIENLITLKNCQKIFQKNLAKNLSKNSVKSFKKNLAKNLPKNLSKSVKRSFKKYVQIYEFSTLF